MLYTDRRNIIPATPLRFARVYLITELTSVRLTMNKASLLFSLMLNL